MINFQVNTLIEWDVEDGKTRIDRILWLDPSGTDMTTIDINSPKALPDFQKCEDVEEAIVSHRARILEKVEPYAALMLPDELIDKRYRKRRDATYVLIFPLVKDGNPVIYNRKERGRLVAELAKLTGRRKAFIYDSLRRFWQRGCVPNAFLPSFHRCGHCETRQLHGPKLGRPSDETKLTGVPTGINITPEIQALFRLGIKKFFLSGEAKNLIGAWRMTKEKYFNCGRYELKDGTLVPLLPSANELPTYEQFVYHYKKGRSITKEIISREGQNEYDLKHRPVLGDSTLMAFGPGSIFQIDATVGDIYLVSYLDRNRLIGRPVIYFVIDVFSRMIVGMCVTLEGPSWEGARLALENATTDKVAFCKEYGIDITDDEWPSHHLGSSVSADRGELISKNSDSLVNCLNVRISNAPRRRPEWKPVIERNFRTQKDIIVYWLPGEVRPMRDVKGGDYRLEAKLDLNQFREMLIRSVLYYNNSYRLKKYRMDEFMIQDKVEPYPIKLWEYGTRNRSGHLRTVPPEMVRMGLLPSDTATVTSHGIRFRDVFYTCELALREEWFTRIKGKKARKLPIAFEPRCVDEIYLRLDNGRRHEPCRLVEADQRFKGRDWYEVMEYFALKKQADKASQTQQQQADAEFHARTGRIISEATLMTNEADDGRSNRARTRNISGNRKSLRDYERRQGTKPTAESDVSQKTAEVVQIKPVNQLKAVKGYVAPAKPYDQLRKASRKARRNVK